MNISQPNPISECYIAYFDILGYQEFCKESPEKAQDFLNVIHSVISNTVNSVHAFNDSPLISQLANLHIRSKIFSDNILLCIETGPDILKEKQRVITFIGLVSEIQRKFITEYKLFLRGGITKGKLSINDDYIFGEGLIEAVKMEESTLYPRIAISDKVINFLEKIQLYSQEEADRAVSIENRSKNGEQVSDEDYEFYQKMLNYANQEFFALNMCAAILCKCADDVWCLSYLYCLDIRSYIPEQALEHALAMMKRISLADFEKIPKTFPNIDLILSTHKQIVEKKLIKHSDYSSYATEDIKRFESQERVLKKYVWSMVYHNYMCNLYNKPEHYINTQGNWECRHMKLKIHVFDKDGKIMNT
ncbi:MAG: hypothetical protein NC247_01570 [Ruminococcus flavefaciens]|nr:hypothetical protein [Ruminococcus flavefaciens]MCM1360453.1 hypothetical protein [Clostridiales bacterium]MCM1434840.1 hypothetical protein [Ruminococcus flavefaciens]